MHVPTVALALVALCATCLASRASATPFPVDAGTSDEKRFVVDGEHGAEITRHDRRMTFRWRQSADLRLSLQIRLPTDWGAMQQRYRPLPHGHRHFESRYVQRDPYRPLVGQLADRLEALADRHRVHRVDVAVRFVQSLPFAHGMGPYQRYASETLIDATGDCSDTSVLLASILTEMDVAWRFVSPPKHLAVAVADGRQRDARAYATIGGRDYYFVETTGYGFDVGEVPSDYIARKSDWILGRSRISGILAMLRS